MTIRRGDVVLIDHPFSDATGSKVRPVLVVQSDVRNAILSNTIVAMITKNLAQVGRDPSQLLIDLASPAGRQTGLKVTSAITCGNLFTVHESLIRKRRGSLPSVMMRQVDDCLKVALGLP